MHRTPPGLASSSVECCSEFEEDDDDEAEQQVPYVFSRLFEESREKGLRNTRTFNPFCWSGGWVRRDVLINTRKELFNMNTVKIDKNRLVEGDWGGWFRAVDVDEERMKMQIKKGEGVVIVCEDCREILINGNMQRVVEILFHINPCSSSSNPIFCHSG